MRSYWKAGLAAWLGIFSATAALAQNWTITIGADQKIASTTLQTSKVNIVTQDQAVTVTCPGGGVDCSNVDLHLVNNALDLTASSSSATSATFTIPKSGVSNGTKLAVTFPKRPNGTEIGSFPLGTDGVPSLGSNQQPPSTAPTLAQLLALECPGNYTAGYHEPTREERKQKREEAKQNGTKTSSWWANPQAAGGIVVTPLGDVLSSGLDTLFDENDVLVVTVVADKRLLPLLTVDRTSAFRDVTAVQILGAGQTAPDLARQSAPVADCGTREFRLENFAPGQGKVQISALQGTTPTPIGNFDFNVNALYTGMLTLGAARTEVVDPGGFKLASVAGQMVIAADEDGDGDDDLVYSLFYTPFLWGKRDVQKSVPFWQHLNLSIGVAPEDITQNAFAGITADLPAGIAVTWGWHFRQIETLTQDLTVGSPFTGTADQIPTTKDWDDGKFWAVSIDLRAMVQVLRAALGTGGGS
jgi:hypothetical protein